MNKKKIYVVGIGPGAYQEMTGAAVAALEQSDVIVGYTVYIDLVKEHFSEKTFLTTPMRKEVDRCVMAFEEAEKGQKRWQKQNQKPYQKHIDKNPHF